ncbi:MAG: ATP-binding protein [Clostridia bacterium]|jgi:adenylate kinase family enzyme|nr:ATP-binding protein [Clostridia bacterium]
MKNIAIFGASRSGKSTLSRMIAKKYPQYQIFVGDDIRGAFQHILPQNKINSRGGSGMQGDFQKFLAYLFYKSIKSIKRNKGDFNYIVETCDMEPEQAKELFNEKNTIVLFLGFPKQTVEQHIEQIKEYQTPKDWTYTRTEKCILEHAKDWTKKSKEFEEKCKELDIWFVDTSKDREKVLKDTIQTIENLIAE